MEGGQYSDKREIEAVKLLCIQRQTPHRDDFVCHNEKGDSEEDAISHRQFDHSTMFR